MWCEGSGSKHPTVIDALLVVVEVILLADRHGENASNPVVVLSENLVALWRCREWADAAFYSTTRLAAWEWLHKHCLDFLVTNVLHLVLHRRKDWCGTGRNIDDTAFLTELRWCWRSSNLELAIGDKVHRVDGVLVRRILATGRQCHLHEATDTFDLGNRLVQVWARRAAVQHA